jgi:hypothetical protein
VVVVYSRLLVAALAGLVLVSAVAGQAVIQNEEDGKSDINADFLDGFDRSAFLLASGDDLTGALNANFYTVANLSSPDDPRDAAPKRYVDLGKFGNLSKTLSINDNAGDNDINMSGNDINQVNRINGQLVQDLGTSNLTEVLDEGNTASTSIDMTGNKIRDLSDPTNPQDAATKNYVDTTDNTIQDDQTLGDVLNLGNTATRDIDLSGQEIEDTSGSITLSGNIEIPSGNVGIRSGDLSVSGSLDETADVAEVMEKRDSDAEIEAGDVVAVKQGEVTKNTSGSSLNMVVSAKPGVRLGGQVSQKLSQEEQERLEEKRLDIAFTGRVPTKILGGAESGDYVTPSGGNNGTAVAVPEEEIGFQEYKEAVGVVLERFQVPEHMSKNNTEKYREVLREAQGRDYQIYDVAVGVK